jgi:hypothetical protein
MSTRVSTGLHEHVIYYERIIEQDNRFHNEIMSSHVSMAKYQEIDILSLIMYSHVLTRE